MTYRPDNPDWYDGYLTGENERIVLATALDACRFDLHEALERVGQLERYIARREAEQEAAR